MRLRPASGFVLILGTFSLACGAGGADERAARIRDSIAADSVRRADSLRAAARADSIRADSIRTDSIRLDSLRRDSLRADSIQKAALAARPPAPASARAVIDSASPLLRGKGERRRKFLSRLRQSELARWPVEGPAPRPGALLPKHRIVAYYGNPLSKRMGILGEIPPDQMMRRLDSTAALWQRADTATRVLPALHLIVTVAQGGPGADGKYRLRMSDTLIERVAGWAESRGWLMFLDVQTGLSTVQDELPRLAPYLARPYMHLALDPEFAMTQGGLPGKKIGTLDAEHINYAIQFLGEIVDRHQIPPKVLVIHRFTQRMLTNYQNIELDPRVQVVIDMDGFGAPWLKEDSYRFFIVPEPVQFTGFKLFYKNDKPLMTPEQVLELYPEPGYIQYQ